MASGCQICAQTGQCNAAFHNGPGQYCGFFSDPTTSINKPCCCPLQATCKVSPFACKCHVSDHQTPASNGYYPQPTTHHYPQQYHHRSPISSLIITLLFFLGCFWCCCRRRDDRGHYEHVPAVPVASAVPATCPSENPQYHPVPVPVYGVGGGGGGGGGGTGTAIASGLGGLAAGTFIGDMLGRNNAQGNNQGGFGAGWGGGGGGGYDIVGDSGGGGYDIAGDTGGGGGGGDFAGDS